MEEKLAVASNNNPNQLLNQISEILVLDIYKHKKLGYLVGKIYLFFFSFL